jgi:hypothetical protein
MNIKPMSILAVSFGLIFSVSCLNRCVFVNRSFFFSESDKTGLDKIGLCYFKKK